MVDKKEKTFKILLTYIKTYNIILNASRVRKTFPTGCGSAWLERLVWDQEVAGSNPVTPTFYDMRV